MRLVSFRLRYGFVSREYFRKHDAAAALYNVKVPSTFWLQTTRVLSHLFAGDTEIVSRCKELIERIASAPPAEQHWPASQLIGIMGRMPNAREHGFAFGRQIPVTAYGDLALGLKIAPTFGEALRLMAKHHAREVPLVHYTYTETESEGHFCVGFRCPIEKEGEAILISAIAAMTERELWRMTGRPGSLKALRLTDSSAGWEQAYQRQGFVLPTTGHDTNAIIISRATLDHPNSIADPDTFQNVVTEYERTALLHETAPSPTMQAHDLIMARIANPPSLDTLAAALHLTRRQLRLALTRDGTSYQQIVQRCRVEYAIALLKNRALSVSQVADRLGYSDVAAFTHSFTKWTGKNPSRFRDGLTS